MDLTTPIYTYVIYIPTYNLYIHIIRYIHEIKNTYLIIYTHITLIVYFFSFVSLILY